MTDPTITRVAVLDLRFPPSREGIGFDALNAEIYLQTLHDYRFPEGKIWRELP